MKLRDYQTQVIHDVYDSLSGGAKRVLVCAATGSGKTIVMAKLLSDFVAQGLRCLVLVHLDILVPQTAEKLEAFGLEHGYIKSGYKEDRNAPVQIASIQTLPRRKWWRSHRFDVVILDECHRTAWSTIANQLMNQILPQAWYVGFTATPFRLSSKQGMGDKFDSLVCAPLPGQLIEMGYLVRPVYYGAAELDLKNVRIQAGDYSESDLSVVCNQPQVIASAISEYQRLGPGERCLAFAVDVAHARNLAQAARDAGIPAAAVDGSTSIPTRREYYQALASGQLQFLSSCNVLSEGFDVPAASVALLCRPTKSKALYFQQLGRVLRPAERKERAIVIDQAGNVRRFGFVEDLEMPTLERGESKQSGEMPVKPCPKDKADRAGKSGCGAILRVSAKQCPHCGYLFGSDLKVLPTGPMVQLSNFKHQPLDCPHREQIEALIAMSTQRNYRIGWVGFEVKKLPGLGLDDLRYTAIRLGYHRNWAIHAWVELQSQAVS